LPTVAGPPLIELDAPAGRFVILIQPLAPPLVVFVVVMIGAGKLTQVFTFVKLPIAFEVHVPLLNVIVYIPAAKPQYCVVPTVAGPPLMEDDTPTGRFVILMQPLAPPSVGLVVVKEGVGKLAQVFTFVKVSNTLVVHVPLVKVIV